MRAYKLLPFKFTRLINKELLVSEVGDFVLAPNGTVKMILEGNISSKPELYKDLLGKYIICTDYNPLLQDILATRLRTKKSFLNGTALHIFILTLRCNQKCIYCQALSQDERTSTKTISKETLDHAIDLMLQSPNPCITMEFQGGDSSLVPELVEYAVEVAEKSNAKIGKEIKYVLCTNLIKLNPSLLNICKRYHIFISTSLDGPEILHDHNRGMKGSYKCFKQNLEIVRNELGHSRVSPLMTTSEFSLCYPKEIIDSYRELGFRNMFLRPLNPYGRAKDNANWELYYDRFFEFYKEALEYILKINQKGNYFREDFTAMLMKKILTPFPIGFVDLQSPAGIINSVIVYNYDGYVYCSDESRMMAETGDYTFRLGRVDNTYQEIFCGEKARQLSKIWATEYIAGCSDCAYFQYCGADPVRNHATQGDWYGHRPTSLFCRFHKEVFNYLFTLIDKHGKEVLPIFLSWAYDR
ncbi:MAG: His-Xaa-Ser system radical SAM maturase HxsB [Prevotella sp.]|nr:His-Xaa-Ser system radical SAM maturase HxsB [Prevotella sp.]